MAGFVAVVMGKGGLNLIIIPSSLQRVSCSLLQKCVIDFLDLARGWDCVWNAGSCENSEGVVGERLSEGMS